jgi:glyoxylase-like metal-dependent hydrolase (beta-lactamase superfamily II)
VLSSESAGPTQPHAAKAAFRIGAIATSRDIVPGVHRLGSSLVNWYLVEDGGRFTAVDAGLPAFKNSLAADLAGLGVAPRDVAAVILTHSDADHTGLTAVLHEAGARVLIHSADEPKLRRPGPKSGDASPINAVREMWRPAFWRFVGGMARAGGARPTKFEHAETFGDGDQLDVPGSARVLATPGHTPGHCAFEFESREVTFVGDELCTRSPLTGRTGAQLMPAVFNESNRQCFASLDTIAQAGTRVLLPGHGEPWLEGAAAAAQQARQLRR